MSHVVKIKIQVKDLDALADAAEAVGCELVRGQQTYKWYGRSVGDTPLPEGFTEADLGHCTHAIRVKGADRRTYEVGVVANADGQGYTLLWDEWNRGYGLVDKVGEGAAKLRQAYATSVAVKQARKAGYRVRQTVREDGTVVLTATK